VVDVEWLHAVHLCYKMPKLPFVTSRKAHRYLLAVVDVFTKFVAVEAVKNTKARYVTKTLLDLLYLFGTPTQVTIDRGTAFTSQRFKEFCNPTCEWTV
jgi:transposase InsO family protein